VVDAEREAGTSVDPNVAANDPRRHGRILRYAGSRDA
jgi:hypothetical protein